MVLDYIIYALLMVIFLLVGAVGAYQLLECEHTAAKRHSRHTRRRSHDFPLRTEEPQSRTAQR